MQLTKAEEQVIRFVGKMEEGLSRTSREVDDPKPARNTVSTVSEFWRRKVYSAQGLWQGLSISARDEKEYSGSNCLVC